MKHGHSIRSKYFFERSKCPAICNMLLLLVFRKPGIIVDITFEYFLEQGPKQKEISAYGTLHRATFAVCCVAISSSKSRLLLLQLQFPPINWRP